MKNILLLQKGTKTVLAAETQDQESEDIEVPGTRVVVKPGDELTERQLSKFENSPYWEVREGDICTIVKIKSL